MDNFDKTLMAQLKDLDDLAERRPLAFLEEARQAYAEYDRRMRREARRLTAKDFMPLDFYVTWQTEYMARMRKIHTNIEDGKLARAMKTVLLMEDTASQQWLGGEIAALCMIRERQKVLKSYSGSKKRVQKMLGEILARDEAQILWQVEIGMRYEMYRLVAFEHGLWVEDVNAGFFRRGRLKRRSRRQVRQLTRRFEQQLAEVEIGLAEIEQLHDGLAVQLLDLKVDMIEVVAARQNYDKLLAKMSLKSQQNPAKKLAAYEKATADIRKKRLEDLSSSDSLAAVSAASQQLDEVLLRAFEFSAAERNEMMRQLKRHRELTAQKVELQAKLSLQRN